MSENEALQGLSCPKCGGMVPIPEGEVIVQCPFCELRSVVKGERGLRRYQVPCRINRQQASAQLQKFLHRSLAIARDAPRTSTETEAFVAYLPFWAAWGRVLGWAFGEQKVGSGDHQRYEPREIKVMEEMSWNGVACDVGEFGVTQVPLDDQQLQPFAAATLHSTGLVFEPVGSLSDARQQAKATFNDRIRSKTRLSRVSQLTVRTVRERLGLVYYPLWIIRYLYRGRAYQIALDGYNGNVLYGKAPGNTLYRAAALVGGMAAGAFLSIDVSSLILSASGNNSENGVLGAAAIAFLGGLVLMYAGYRAFRYGEQYEYRSGPKAFNLDMVKSLTQNLGGVGEVIDMLEK
ncbi:MAG: hypothetical protein M1281_18000 [Chloroflexi bacterium]|nr:hypothetical protein [Chloroflexota bacterium]